VEGKRYYNDSFDKVVEDRKLRGDDFDKYFFEKLQEEDTSSKEQGKAATRTKQATLSNRDSSL
jgi:hypothetical protein